MEDKMLISHDAVEEIAACMHQRPNYKTQRVAMTKADALTNIKSIYIVLLKLLKLERKRPSEYTYSMLVPIQMAISCVHSYRFLLHVSDTDTRVCIVDWLGDPTSPTWSEKERTMINYVGGEHAKYLCADWVHVDTKLLAFNIADVQMENMEDVE
jgi:hypothetical protein